MNCWRGVCKYRSDDNYCNRDGLECDMQGLGQWQHTCHYEREHEDFLLTCREACCSYDWCEET